MVRLRADLRADIWDAKMVDKLALQMELLLAGWMVLKKAETMATVKDVLSVGSWVQCWGQH